MSCSLYLIFIDSCYQERRHLSVVQFAQVFPVKKNACLFILEFHNWMCSFSPSGSGAATLGSSALPGCLACSEQREQCHVMAAKHNGRLCV